MSKSRSGAPRRVAVGLLASALSVVGIALAPPAGAVDDVNADRLAGINRYGTAAAIAGQDDFDGATTAILATGETFPDALAASGLAGSNAPAPIILTESNVYSDEARETLNNLTSITDVVIVGGTAAISQDVQDDIEADGFTVSRVAGADRYETAADIAGEIGTIGEVDGLVTALIATGTGFADALAGGPLAYAGQHPILLVTPQDIPAATSAAITDLGIEQAIILGGTAAVSDEVAAEIDDLTGNPSVRVADVNRFGTAAAVGEYAVENFGWAPTEVLLASGLNFPDALAGGPLGGERSAPVLLTASLPAETEAFLDAHSDTIEQITALGGTGVIDEETLNDAEDAAELTTNDDDTPTNATATTRPELVSATVVETRTAATATATRPAGTYVRYCFDEPITGATPTAASFFLYNGDGTRFAGTSTFTDTAGRTFTSGVTATDNKCAEIIFGAGEGGAGTLDTAAEAANLTLATVDNGAATGAAGAATDTNIEGDAPLTPSGSSTAASGATSAPDLVSVGNFRAGSTGDVTAVDFTFDVAAFVTAGQAFGLVATDGTSYSCSGPAPASATASGSAAPGGNGTTVITVNCVEPGAAAVGPTPSPTSIQHTAENVARGTVGSGSVATLNGGTVLNPLEAADVANGGNSNGPDLVLAVFAPDAVANQDVVGYLFDESIQAGAIPVTGGTVYFPNNFGIYTSSGAERLNGQASGEFCARSAEAGNVSVQCVFADGVLSAATYVGANVRAGAVTDVDADTATTNGADEVGVAPSSGPSAATGGTTDGPDLTAVTINEVLSPFGNASYTATFTFDEDTSDTGDTTSTSATAATDDVVAQLLHLYTADGIRLDCSGISGGLTASAALAARSEDADNTITCSSFIVGTAGPAATSAQVRGAVVGTVDFGAVDDETTGATGDVSPEGAALTTGGNGTPAS